MRRADLSTEPRATSRKTRRGGNGNGGVMLVDYQREFILANIDLAQRYETCGHMVNCGDVLLAVIYDGGEDHDLYAGAVSDIKFEERGVNEIEDVHVRIKGECIAYYVREKRCKVIISSDEELNSRLVKALCLKPCASNAVL